MATVLSGGTPAELAQAPTAQGAADPVRVLFIGDSSRSQHGAVFGVPLVLRGHGSKTSLDHVAEALGTHLAPGVALRVASFAERFLVSPSWVTTREDVRRAFDAVDQTEGGYTVGPSPIWDAVYEGADTLAPEPGRKFMLLVTDGAATANTVGFESALAHVRASGITVHVASTLTSPYARDEWGPSPLTRLRRLAAETGGQYREVGKGGQQPKLWEVLGELMDLCRVDPGHEWDARRAAEGARGNAPKTRTSGSD
ncbi:MAG: vWA domain-containing protein [Vicinamibacterales bacterium]